MYRNNLIVRLQNGVWTNPTKLGIVTQCDISKINNLYVDNVSESTMHFTSAHIVHLYILIFQFILLQILPPF